MRWYLLGMLLITLAHIAEAGEKPGWKMASPLVFSDEQARILSGNQRTEKIEAVVDVLGLDGWGPPSTRTVEFRDGVAFLMPTGEGIHRVKLSGAEVRFVAISPPRSIEDPKSFPQLWEKLSRGDPVTILVMGDSATATGSYPEMLAMMLRRATGGDVRIERRTYSGKSVDASVRRFEADLKGMKPDLALIMYGLNDQGANVPLIAYLEQYAWLAERLRRDYGAEVAFLEPTPHINILTPGRDGQFPAEAAMFRTIVYAAALRDLGAKLNVPVAGTFSAIWGNGAADLKSEAQILWPLYPTHYSKPYESLTESAGKGDTIHPNALGHSLLAKSVFASLLGEKREELLKASAWTQWVKEGLETVIAVENISRDRRRGQAEIYPIPENDLRHTFDYDLGPGERKEWRFHWPGVQKSADLLREPQRRVFRFPGPFIQVLYRENGGSRVTAIAAPLRIGDSIPTQRLIVQKPEAEVEVLANGGPKKIRMIFPPNQEVGRLVVKEGQAIAELAFVRFGAAFSGEAVIDGSLDEWKPEAWLPLGESVQARWTNGPQDNRKTIGECYTRWSFAAGKKGIAMAFRGTANTAKDTVTVYFDTRGPELLGSAGPYYWADLKFAAGGKVSVKMGDSSPSMEGAHGVWEEKGGELTGEVFVPYAALGMEAWPQSGDLGLSIAWRHIGPDGRTTTLQWAEDGHPWNTRWFGVVRLNPVAPLPFRVRVE